MYARYSVLAALLLIAPLAAAADSPPPVNKLGEFHGWTAYMAGKDAGRVCYIVGEARSEGSGDSNGAHYAYVAHRPAKKAWSVVMFYPGTPYQTASQATVEIGKSRFSLFTYKDTAWATDADADARLVKAMRAGKTMVVHGVDAAGGAIEDKYSLTGFIAAYRRIGEACDLK